MENIRCAFDAPTYLIISEEVTALIYYSHFIAIFAALSISLLVFFHNPKLLVSRLFLVFASVLSTWIFLDVILWSTNDPGIVMFSWSMQVLLEPMLYAIAFYLFYAFLYGDIPSFWTNVFVTIILLPLIILLPTNLNVDTVYLSFCETDEGPLALYYTYFLNICFILLTIYSGLKGIKLFDSQKKKAATYFVVGLIIFMLSFTVANIISSLTDNWDISQYGLFGMPIFAALIAYSIVQFSMFRIQMAGAQFLVVTLLALVTSLLFVKSELQRPVTIITIVFTAIVGFFLMRSVKKEFTQKLELENLTERLKKANERLRELDQMKSEFVSIASHQLRSPLTSIRGYASMLLEGTYGRLSEKATQAITRISESSQYMAASVEDYLNVSRIEAGNMKYELIDFNLKDEASHVSDDKRQEAIKKALLLSFKSDMDTHGIVNADIGKTRQILHNLINNALKYTPRGTVTVFAHDDKKKKLMHVDIIDSGIGMKPDELEDIFGKFERAHNANETNVTITGRGLFVARKMARAMGGDVTAHSDGVGHGSTFRLTLPLQM